MSHNNTSNIYEYSRLLYVLIIIMSLYFGYVVGKDHKEDYLNEQQQIKQKELEKENGNN